MTTGITSFVLDRLTEGLHEPIEIDTETATAVAAEVDRARFGPDLEAVVEELLALAEVLEQEERSPTAAEVLVAIVDRESVIDELIARRPAATFERATDIEANALRVVGVKTAEPRRADAFRPEQGVLRFGISRRV